MPLSTDTRRNPTPSREERLFGVCGLLRAQAVGARSRCDDDGVSLIEVLVAFVVLLIVMLPMGILLTHVSNEAAVTRQRQAALQLADSWIEVLSNSTPPTGSDRAVMTNVPAAPVVAAGVQTPQPTLAGTTFAVTANYTEALVNGVGQSDLCADGLPPSPSHPGVIQLQVRVTWDQGRYSAADSTNISYPKPGLQTQGFLAVDVSNDGLTDKFGNSATTRLEAQPVTIQQQGSSPTLSPNPLTLYPDANGCVFAQVPVGTYDVMLNPPSANTPSSFVGWPGSPAFVTPAGAQTYDAGMQTVSVTSEAVVQMQAYDEGINASLTYGGASSVDGALACPATTAMTCLVTGNGTSSAQAAWSSGGGTWSSAGISGATNINQVACTPGAPSTCVAVGDTLANAVALTTSATLRTATADTLPGNVTDLTKVTCPSAHGCYALGASASGPVLLGGAVGEGSASADRWTILSPPTPLTALNSVACATSTICLVTGSSAGPAPVVLRLDGDPAALAGNSAWVPDFTTDALPTGATGTTSVGTVSCPTSTTCLALATGDTAGSTDPTILTMAVASTGADTWAAESTFPTGATDITDITCTTSTCMAVGSLQSGAHVAVWTGDLATSPHRWSQAQGIPTTVVAATSVACGVPDGGDTADCILGVTTSDASTPGQLLDGTLLGGSWVWNLKTPQVSSPVLYYLGVSCVNPTSASTATCMAVGATGKGPVIATTTTGPNGSWTAQITPAGSGSVVTGIPLQTSPSSNTEWTTQFSHALAQKGNATSLNGLYPDPGGYSLAAGDCSAVASGLALASLDALPGDTASPTVPLDLVDMQVLGTTGAPLAGATVTLSSTQCSGDDYSLPTSDANGITSSSIPYGSYTYTVTARGTTYPANGINLIFAGQTVSSQAPASLVSTPVSNGQSVISWTSFAPDNGPHPATYTVTESPDGLTCTTTTTTCVITGITGTSPTYSVQSSTYLPAVLQVQA